MIQEVPEEFYLIFKKAIENRFRVGFFSPVPSFSFFKLTKFIFVLIPLLYYPESSETLLKKNIFLYFFSVGSCLIYRSLTLIARFFVLVFIEIITELNLSRMLIINRFFLKIKKRLSYL